MNEVIAHVYKDNSDRYQLLSEHLINVGSLMYEKCDPIGLKHLGSLIGLFHDIGKSTPEFQQYIRGKLKKSEKTKHSHKSSQVFIQYCIQCYTDICDCNILSLLVGFAIAFHHTGLENFYENDRQYSRSLNKKLLSIFDNDLQCDVLEYFKNLKKYHRENFPTSENIKKEFQFLENKIIQSSQDYNILFYWGMTLRLLLGFLFDADWKDTSNFFNNVQLDVANNNNNLFNKLWEDNIIYSSFIKEKESNSNISEIRKSINDKCMNTLIDLLENNRLPYNKILSLNLPTGTGKTIISFRMAIEIAKRTKKRKIVYVIPYNSIIEQTAEVIRNYLGSKYESLVLEHHSSVETDSETDYASYRILSESWDSEIIITSAVQYLHVFYSVGKQFNRRLSKLVNSVVIFDEIQSIPNRCTQLFLRSLYFLTEFMESRVILTSATVPDYSKINGGDFVPLKGDKIINLLDDNCVSELQGKMGKRCKLINYLGCCSDNKKQWDDERLSQDILGRKNSGQSVMVICNTIPQVISLYQCLMKEVKNTNELFMLSTRFCPKERKDTLALVKNKLKNKEIFILVTTPLIEAGVDIDFPVVYRYTSSWFSIIQAAGRCNRNGCLERGFLYIVDHQNNDPIHLGSLKEIDNARIVSEKLILQSGVQFGEEITSLEDISNQFSQKVMSNGVNYIYNIPNENTSVEALLTGENNLNHAFQNSIYYFTQCFRSASELFKPIEEHYDVKVFVKLDSCAENLINEFNNLQRTEFMKKMSIFRQLQQYKIELRKCNLDKLKKEIEAEQASVDSHIIDLKIDDTYVFSRDIYEKYKELS